MICIDYSFSHFIGLICYAQNDAIHVLIKEAGYEDVKEKIVVGFVYQISKFFSRDSQEKYIVVKHRAQLLCPSYALLPLIPNIGLALLSSINFLHVNIMMLF